MRGVKLVGWIACLVLFGGTGHWGTPPSAEAQPPPAREGNANAPITERSVEELRDALQALRSPAARQLRAAQDALPRQPAEALRLATLLQQDPLFLPYGLQLEAAGSRNQARELLAGGKREEALEAAKKALALYQRAEESCPSPVAVRKLPEELGRTEAVAGEALHARQQWPETQKLYESAFAHFDSVDLLMGFQPETLGRYAESCARQAPPPPAKPSVSPTCAEWLRRFIQLEGRTSPKARAITKHVSLEALGPFPPAPSRKPTAPTMAPDAEAFTRAMALYRARKFAEAAAAFQALPEAWPASPHVLRARYWRGRALARGRKPAEAKQVFKALVEDAPLTWYGMLAATASGEDLQARISSATPKAAARDAALDSCEQQRLERAEHFLAEGMAPLAAEELQGLASREPARLGAPFLLYLAMLHSEAGDDPAAFQAVAELLRRKHPGALTPFALRLLFPPRHLEFVQKYAAEHALEPALVLGVMKQESSFRTNAESGQGAIGLMQLLPSTADGLERGTGRLLFQVEPNIRVGTKYLRYLVDYFCGNRALALASYNAGMGRVAGWKRQGLVGTDLVDFIESIPLRETRDYVAQIIRNHYWYSSRILETKARPLEHFWPPGGAAKTGRCAPKPVKRKTSGR
ncbi:lytic transglycosylase domain-containing protein [Myxococcus sp. RHSTA-1-4]|uniref:lytic transglycosylase domain-containing protein n=1 Tax=Myxococcus sp. RHSTA-1-4 TaxID=2874601 RepID=UPI001CBDF963|nr:lytic transglycosylase domain-containing protein [Myxococcus sp. RHSTA-1-4]MBZ4416910.1 lytic transglycosylase domain-containing protein [Myxococcus sp. RHSTA-1-4]